MTRLSGQPRPGLRIPRRWRGGGPGELAGGGMPRTAPLPPGEYDLVVTAREGARRSLLPPADPGGSRPGGHVPHLESLPDTASSRRWSCLPCDWRRLASRWSTRGSRPGPSSHSKDARLGEGLANGDDLGRERILDCRPASFEGPTQAFPRAQWPAREPSARRTTSRSRERMPSAITRPRCCASGSDD